MKWFEGSIADAVTASKARNAVFVVYIEGPDEMSSNMSKAMDSGVISSELASSTFVCIKLAKDSESHKQFTEIYKIVPVPSLFFIGENGVPLEIVASDNSMENVTKKIRSAITKIRGEPIAIPDMKEASSEELSDVAGEVSFKTVCDSNVSTSEVAKPSPVETPVTTSAVESVAPTNVSSSPNEDILGEMERVQDIIKKNREANDRLEAEKEKERELARRRMGKEISQARKSQQDRELEELRREREKEKKLEAEARQRVLRHIEEDKANRAAKMAAQAQPEQTKPAEQSPPTTHRTVPNEARIQFKLPDGQSRTQTFSANTTLRQLRAFIDSNIKIPFHEYMLATTFPRREFTSRDLDSDLASLSLLPSSVVLILPVQGNMSMMSGNGWSTALTTMFWTLIQPLLDFGAYLRSFVSGRRDDDASSSTNPLSVPSNSQPGNQQDDQQQQSRIPYYAQAAGGGRSVRKRGNIHTLSDGHDSNDENNTWNGNSTQLM